MLTRRTLLQNALKTSAAFTLSPSLLRASSLTLRLAKAAPIELPADFIGLGYEMSSVAPLGLLSAANSRYVELVRGLAPHGVLRVGGIVANYTRYDPNGTIVAEPQNTVITRASLEQFAGFLRKIGWTSIWSVNFAQGTLQEAIDEARTVVAVLGPQLQALEIGNEVENYSRGQSAARKAPYEYENFRAEYAEWHDAILKAAPGVRFAAPDTATSVEWVERMARDAKDSVQLLATHYYRNGQKRGSADQLLTPDPRLQDVLTRMRAASLQSGIPWRICETNSFSGGGLPGVSDTFIGALWTLDFMLLLASYGCSGVNIETGVNQLGFVSSYSPIPDDGHGVNAAGVPYYGMLAFAKAFAGCDAMLPLDFDAHGINLTAYALGSPGKPISIVIVNRDKIQDADMSIAELGLGTMSLQRLAAPAADSKTSVTFAGASVDTSGMWKPASHETVRNGRVTVPHMSAVVLRHV